MSYVNAPATEMLASNCAFCARPLVDAQSVETGIGPICRKKWMVADAVTDEARTEGNKLIHTIAKLQTGKEVISAVARLKELGFAEVVKRINKRIKPKRKAMVVLSYEGERLHLVTPWSPSLDFGEWLKAMRSVGGMRYEGKGQGNSFPKTARKAVYKLLCRFFPGIPATGPMGDFTIPA